MKFVAHTDRNMGTSGVAGVAWSIMSFKAPETKILPISEADLANTKSLQ